MEQFRKAHAVSQEALARRAGMAKSTYTRILSGKTDPSTHQLASLADAVGVPPNQLIALYWAARSGPNVNGETEVLVALLLREARRSALRDDGVEVMARPPEAVSDDSRTALASQVALGHSQRARVFVQKFLLELTEAGATDDDVAAARELLTKPEVFTLHHGGRATEASDEEILQVMEASARFIRDTLRERGLKL